MDRPATPEVPGYRLGPVIGSGARGPVWQATRDVDGADCAVRVVAEHGIAPSGTLARELAALTRISHPHLIEVTEVIGRIDVPGNHPGGSVAIVMPRLIGGSAAGLGRVRGRLTPGELVTVGVPVLQALAALHAAGVVHGDVSAGNILFDARGRPVLSDLDGAHVIGSGAPDRVVGTDLFVAPEVLLGQAPGTASDVCSLGTVLWWLATGRRYAEWGPDGWQPDPTGLGVDGPEAEALAAVIAELCAADPADRPPADRAARALFDAAVSRPITPATDLDVSTMLTRRVRLDAAIARERAVPTGRGRHRGQAVPRSRWPVIAVAGVLAVLAGGWVLATRSTAPAESIAPASMSRPIVTPTTPPATAVTAPAKNSATTPATTSTPVGPATAVVQALADRRAAAIIARDPTALAAVDLPGSDALVADTDLIGRLSGSDRRYEGLSFTVSCDDSAVEAATFGEPGRLTAQVRCRFDRSAYLSRSVSDPADSTQVAAGIGESMTVELARSSADGPWLIATLT